MINLCFSLQSHTFIARLKHTNSGKKASCARQNAAFTPRKSIHSTIIRYDIGFRTTLQKTTRKKQKITCSETLEARANREKSAAYTLRMSVFPLESRFGNARNGGKSEKIGRLHPSDVRFFTRLPVRKCSEQEQTQKTGPFPFRMSFFPLKSRIIG